MSISAKPATLDQIVPMRELYREEMNCQIVHDYLVQELKRICREMGSIPCARRSPDNIASRKTLQKAGLVPYAHMLTGSLS